MFIVMEGIDGSGKTTQVALLAEALKHKGYDVITTREPGGTYVCNKIRDIVLNHSISNLSRLLLFSASRIINVEEVVKPSIEEGFVVISDRFTPSTLAYQHYGLGIDREIVDFVNKISSQGIEPTLTFYLRIPLEICIKRIQGKDQFERLGLEFYRRVIEGYESQIGEMSVIDASLSVKEVHQEILSRVERCLSLL